MTAATVPAARLRAVTRLVESDDDVLDALGRDGFAWLRDGCGFVTTGAATRVEPTRAHELLASIEHDDEVGLPATGPLAVGGLPFDPGARGTLVVPEQVVGVLPDGRRWVTQLSPAPHAVEPVAPLPDISAVEERTSAHEWAAMVRAALEPIRRGHLEKVVLARRVDVLATGAFDVRTVVARLRDEQPGCFVYAADGLVGATPELLVRRRGDRVEARPMAGTVVGSDDDARAHLDDSEKDAREHRPVPRAIASALAPWCSELTVPDGPRVVQLASVGHLVTPIEGRLAPPLPDATALVAALHPTPAVGGAPRDLALRTIGALEPVPRGRYAGPVGWIDARGDGDWGVALRGAELDGNRASLHAGAGIVTGSDPDAEWRETEAKLVPMLRALGALA